MSLRAPLPEVCPDHGQPAVRYKKGAAGFFARGQPFGLRNMLKYGSTMNWKRAKPRLRDLTIIRELGIKKGLATWYRGKPIDTAVTMVRGEWPVCSRCLISIDIYRTLGLFMVAVTMLAIGALVLVHLLDAEELLAPLALIVFFGTPFEVLLAAAAFDRSTTYVRGRLTDDRRYLVIRAHPNFAATVRERGIERFDSAAMHRAAARKRSVRDPEPDTGPGTAARPS